MLFSSLRTVIQSAPLCESEKRIFSDELLPSLLTLSKKHAQKRSRRSQTYSIIGAKKAVNLGIVLGIIWGLYDKIIPKKSLNDTKR